MDKKSVEIEFEKLEFRPAKEMKVRPVNVSIEEAAGILRAGNPVVVILEPGDATRYRLLIVPCWSDWVAAELGDIGIPSVGAADYLMVTYFNDEHGDMFFAPKHVEHFDFIGIANEWTRILLAWWVKQLWKVISHCEK